MELLFQEPAPIPTRHRGHVSVVAGRTAARKCRGHDAASRAGMELGAVDDLRQRVVFFINELRLRGAFSPIHLLSVWTLFSLGMAIYHPRKGDFRQHKIWMVLLYVLALLVTGVFTLWPG